MNIKKIFGLLSLAFIPALTVGCKTLGGGYNENSPLPPSAAAAEQTKKTAARTGRNQTAKSAKEPAAFTAVTQKTVYGYEIDLSQYSEKSGIIDFSKISASSCRAFNTAANSIAVLIPQGRTVTITLDDGSGITASEEIKKALAVTGGGRLILKIKAGTEAVISNADTKENISGTAIFVDTDTSLEIINEDTFYIDSERAVVCNKNYAGLKINTGNSGQINVKTICGIYGDRNTDTRQTEIAGSGSINFDLKHSKNTMPAVFYFEDGNRLLFKGNSQISALLTDNSLGIYSEGDVEFIGNDTVKFAEKPWNKSHETFYIHGKCLVKGGRVEGTNMFLVSRTSLLDISGGSFKLSGGKECIVIYGETAFPADYAGRIKVSGGTLYIESSDSGIGFDEGSNSAFKYAGSDAVQFSGGTAAIKTTSADKKAIARNNAGKKIYTISSSANVILNPADEQ